MKKQEIALWTPLIGFDRNHADKGASEYLLKTGIKPTIISLFVYNADFINLHEDGLLEEKQFPADYCNYYGSARNEVRSIQPWTNYDLKELAYNLEKAGVETYCSIMGNHLCSPEGSDEPEIGIFGYEVTQQFVKKHREIALESTLEHGYINLLKRFNDGTYYEDYFIEKTLSALVDYGITGIHLADCIFPPTIQINNGDFSDDMIGQFVTAEKVSLPQELLISLKNKKSPGITARADYIWNRYRIEWINFICKRWKTFFQKLCTRLHSAGKKVMLNNSWTSEVFESVYRYGIDYKMLEEAGVDIICIEDQATILYTSEPEGTRYRIHEYMNMPLIMRAYAPKIKYLCFNYAKDSTEEGSIINHNPPADEREIYMLSSHLYKSDAGTARNSDGFLVCLADTISKSEWDWLGKRYNIALRDEAAESLSATLIWSDAMQSAFLPEYIQTRRWSCHRIVSELSRWGGKIGSVARIESLDKVSGTVFIPNIDLLPQSEIKKIAAYKKGAVIYSSIAGKNFSIPGVSPEIYFEDRLIPAPETRMCFAGFNLGLINYSYITEPLYVEEGKTKHTFNILGEPKYFKDPPLWLEDVKFTAGGISFVKAAARLLTSAAQNIAEIGPDDHVTVYKMGDGRIRFVVENDTFNHYKNTVIRVKHVIKEIINANDFPILPLKLLMPGGSIRPRDMSAKQLEEAEGFVIKIPPSGAAIVDVFFKGLK